jgi:RHH-type proline utilization regulon transcriptional repressor/proline dehydrogenase/delta 1-pyrroline-5-carboxylate dehydrogenase
MHTAVSPATTFVPFDALQAETRASRRRCAPPSPPPTAATKPTPSNGCWRRAPRLHADAYMLAHRLVSSVREKRTRASGVDALMHEFSLSSEEGVALMCLAEALLRIPDSGHRRPPDRRQDQQGRLAQAPGRIAVAVRQRRHLGPADHRQAGLDQQRKGLGSALTKLIAKGGEPLIRKGVDLAMRMLGNQFVTGQTIAEALKNSRDNEARGYRYSYDMLGEAALTEADADNYYASYEAAIHAIGKASNGRGIKDGPGISVKLSALHPRYSRAQHARVMGELLPRVRSWCCWPSSTTSA